MPRAGLFTAFRFAATVVCLVLTLFAPTSRSLGQTRTLLVPQYPASIAEEYPPEPADSRKVLLPSRMQTFFSKDQPEKVLTFYEKKVAKYEETYETNPASYGAVLPAEDVHQFIVKNRIGTGGEAQDDFTHGLSAGVRIYGKPQTYNMNVHGMLDKLQTAYLLRFNTGEETTMPIADHLNDPEFKKILAKYEPLQWQHFMTVKGKRVDDEIIERRVTIPEKKMAEEQGSLSKKMQDLMMAGKYDEAGKVGDQLMKFATRPTDAKINWDEAIGCLDEFAANAYPTRIVIDRPLAEWDLSKVPREK